MDVYGDVTEPAALASFSRKAGFFTSESLIPTMKRCIRCKELKKRDDFVKNQNYCKRCHSLQSEKWRKNNPVKVIKGRARWYQDHQAEQKARVSNFRLSKHAIFKAWKATQVCAQCGENHPACIEFHHRDPSKKEMNISQAWRLGYSWERLLKELSKCDALCANCHRKRHYEEKQKGPKVKRSFLNPKSYRPPRPSVCN